MLDLIGLRLADAENRLREMGVEWSLESTNSPKGSLQGPTILRVARQRYSAQDNHMHLTVVQQRDWEAEFFASKDI